MSKRDKLVWPQGQSCAVSLTYDDGLPVHYDLVSRCWHSMGYAAPSTCRRQAMSGCTRSAGGC